MAICAGESSSSVAGVIRRSRTRARRRRASSVEPGWRRASTPSTSPRPTRSRARADPGEHLAAGVVEHDARRRPRRCGRRARRAGGAACSTAKRCRRASSVARLQPPGRADRSPGARSAARAARRAACRRAAPARVSVRPIDADAVEALQLQHAAGALRPLPPASRSALRTSAAAIAASCASRPLACLANSVCGERVDADDLAAERHRVEIRLEDLALLPGALEPGRGHRLAELLRDAASAAGRAQAVVEQAGELHRQGRCAARARVRSGCPRRSSPPRPSRRRCAPRSAGPRSGRSPCSRAGDISAQRHPGEAAHVSCRRAAVWIGDAVAIEQGEVGGPVRGLDLGERSAAPRRDSTAARSVETTSAMHASAASAALRITARPRSPAFGSSPKLSGAYIASTRVGGSANLPGLLRRTRVLDDVLAARQVLVVAAKGLEAALLERRPGRAGALLAARRHRRVAAEARAEDASRRRAPGR